MEDFSKICFVCKKAIDNSNSELNTELHLPVCNSCKNTEAEQKAVREYLKSMADGFVCGCI